MFFSCVFDFSAGFLHSSFHYFCCESCSLSIRMLFGTYVCLVKIESRHSTTDGALGRLKKIANIYPPKTSTAMSMCVKMLDGGSGPTKSISNRSSGPLLGSIFRSGGRRCCLAIGFDLIQVRQLFMDSCFFS